MAAALTLCSLLSPVLAEHRSASEKAPVFQGGCQLVTFALTEQESFLIMQVKAPRLHLPCPELGLRLGVEGGALQSEARVQNQSLGAWPLQAASITTRKEEFQDVGLLG